MNNNDNNKKCENCFADILKVILLLQQNVCENDSCLQTCDKGFLGQNSKTIYNTRPIVLYTCSNGSKALEMPVSKNIDVSETSSVFRLEKLNNCCATCRVLTKNQNRESKYPYVGTNSFFTINLNCICILRCLEDTYIDCL